jgi:hypothetical protein
MMPQEAFLLVTTRGKVFPSQPADEKVFEGDIDNGEKSLSQSSVTTGEQFLLQHLLSLLSSRTGELSSSELDVFCLFDLMLVSIFVAVHAAQCLGILAGGHESVRVFIVGNADMARFSQT